MSMFMCVHMIACVRQTFSSSSTQDWDNPGGAPVVFDIFDEVGLGVLSGESLKHFACAIYGVPAHKVCVCVCVCVCACMFGLSVAVAVDFTEAFSCMLLRFRVLSLSQCVCVCMCVCVCVCVCVCECQFCA